MRRTVLPGIPPEIPEAVRSYIGTGPLYDSSSSPQAKVYYSDTGNGHFIKMARAGHLHDEAVMTQYFYGLGLGAELLYYGRADSPDDWMVTARIPGEDCTAPQYLDHPKQLTDILATRLRMLHNLSYDNCPIPNHTQRYLARAERNHRLGNADPSFFVHDYGVANLEQIYRIVQRNGPKLRTDVLLHGDYCLPNIILDDWRFSGFIDLDCAGVGDRHVDIFWALWTLRFNMHTDGYRERFLAVYGRDMVDEDMLRTVAAIEVFG